MRWLRAVALGMALTRLALAQAPAAPKGLPLIPTRTIELDTDEGTRISADVSSDGTTVVYDLMGDLCSVPLIGGEVTQLTSGMASVAQPRPVGGLSR